MMARLWIILLLAGTLIGPGSLPPSSASDLIPFTDLTAQAGITFVHRDCTDAQGAGAAFLDYDNDDDQDIYVTNVERPNALYRNNSNGTFTNVAAEAGVTEEARHAERAGSRGVVCADYNNDGWIDIYVLNGGPWCRARLEPLPNQAELRPGRNTLYRNNGNGTFTDVTDIAGVGEESWSACATWGDYDGDGLVDLYVGNYITRIGFIGPSGNQCGPNNLYHNNGDGTFTDMAEALGVAGNGCTLAVSFTDYDNDGDWDLYVANDFGGIGDHPPNVLYRNDGRGANGRWQFTDVSAASRANVSVFSMGIGVGDSDNDGDLDYYVSNIGPNIFLRNNGDSTFTDVAADNGTQEGHIGSQATITWGCEFFDFDNDGWLDLYVAAGWLVTNRPTPREQPNYLFRNNGDGTFTNVAEALGVADPRHSRACIVGDIDDDGDLDIFVNNVDQPPGLYRNEYYSTTGRGPNNWLQLKLTGTRSHRDAFGARIKVVTGSKSQIRELGTSDPAGSKSSLAVSFGLGTATMVDLLEIRWPSGTVQRLNNVAVNQRTNVVEPD
jgi:hypothetical protein